MKRHKPRPSDAFAVETALLAGRPTRWQNLGLWTDTRDYERACEALASRVGEVAGLGPGDRLLELACGSGAAFQVWRERFGVGALIGIELDPARAARASELGRVVCAPAIADRALSVAGRGPFDAVVCVDAAYHLGPVEELARAVGGALCPGGRFAFTTLVAGRRPPPLPCPAALGDWAGRALAARAQIPPGALLPVPALEATLAEAGFVEVTVRRLDEEVLGGFARHVARRFAAASMRERLRPGWLKILGTAALGSLGRASGALGYGLVSARRGRA